jgi:hypothetical protein
MIGAAILVITFVISVILINDGVSRRAAAMDAAMKARESVETWRPQVIAASSGNPMIIYDRERMRVILVDKLMPRGLEVCIHSICLLDTEWQQLYENSRREAVR